MKQKHYPLTSVSLVIAILSVLTLVLLHTSIVKTLLILIDLS